MPISDDHSEDPDPDAPAFILQTSGTASEPKLIPFSHRNMLAAAARVQGWFNLPSQDRCLSASPLFYSHGLKVTVFTPLLTGGSLAFPTDAGKVDYAEWFGVLRPTWYSAGPTLHQLVLDQAQLTADAPTMHSLRFVMSGRCSPSKEHSSKGSSKRLAFLWLNIMAQAKLHKYRPISHRPVVPKWEPAGSRRSI